MTLRLDRLGKAVFEALSPVADEVSWAYGQQNRKVGTLLRMSIGVGPMPKGRHHMRSAETYCPADSIVVTVDAVTVGTRLIMRLNDFDYFTDAIGGDTVTTIRDRLRAKVVDPVTGELATDLTAVDSGADGILLTAVPLGGLRSLFLVGGDLSVGGSAVFSGDAIDVLEGQVEMTLRLEAFSKGHEPQDGAWSIIHAAIERLQLTSVSEEMTRLGVSMGTKGAPIDLSGISGADFETRVLTEVQLFSHHVAVEEVDHITTVNLNVTVDGNLVAASATAP